MNRCWDKLLIIDEVQRKPELFRLLRSEIDASIRNGERTCQFLILCSTSRDLLRQSSESLAGITRYIELNPFSILEICDFQPADLDIETLWLRGGFPASYLASSEDESWKWRGDFIASYVERDIPQMGMQIPSVTMRNFWSMLAWENSQQISYYRTSAQAEIDLFLEGSGNQVWAVETKRSMAPKVTRGFYLACEDVGATEKFVIYSGVDQFSLGRGVEATGAVDFLRMIR